MHSRSQRGLRLIAVPGSMSRRGSWVLAVAVIALALLAVACGSEGAAAGTNGNANPTPSAEAASDDMTQVVAPEEPDALAFAQCMRANGVANFPDPPSGSSGFRIDGSVSSNPNLQSAMETCAHLRPVGGMGPGSVDDETLLAFAQCMRDNGVPEFPDPTGGGGGGMAVGGQGPGGFNPYSPQFQEALAVCGPDFGITINVRPQ